ncbi:MULTISPECIES: sugar phosphate isomerase/epimerase family protein [Olivibacter]|uniref:Xylose isomerase domain-containing protein TIM barrel n=2 Tax=Sphingobacteriaceae TaxID=84566 RepID=F4C1Z0_SPHS2|nr:MULTISPECIES: sugar phosphate isomerase/epimerase family protein [Olivibacter]MCL4639242.1 sugar phosphate isomerase/epimerase [Olivibacter sp. UJ_SKK_5.1]MDM8174733.1 sugar phosphate isomerase/epimerase family protein [Olivibacter sp. 47]
MSNRREFLKQMGAGALGLTALSNLPLDLFASTNGKYFFDISLAQWSLHKTLFGKQMDNLDFAETAAKKYGIFAVEYVNQFFKDKAKDQAYLKDMLKRSKDNGVKNVLIMVDGEGSLGAPDDAERKTAVENHYKWVEAAKFLGCHAIRVNAAGKGSAEEVKGAAIDGLGRLSEFAAKHKINVIVENHGGMSSDGQWLSAVLKQVGKKNCGSLPDFGNFYEYDRYQGVTDLMPFAKGVSAKTHDFDNEGNETQIDYLRMMKIVKDAGYKGHVGIEYEGSKLSEDEGIKKTKLLLEKVGAALS